MPTRAGYQANVMSCQKSSTHTVRRAPIDTTKLSHGSARCGHFLRVCCPMSCYPVICDTLMTDTHRDSDCLSDRVASSEQSHRAVMRNTEHIYSLISLIGGPCESWCRYGVVRGWGRCGPSSAWVVQVCEVRTWCSDESEQYNLSMP